MRRENMIAAFEEATDQTVSERDRARMHDMSPAEASDTAQSESDTDTTEHTGIEPDRYAGSYTAAYYGQTTGTRQSRTFTRDESGEWVPYLGPDGGEGWQQIDPESDNPDRTVIYDDEPPGDPLYEGAGMVNLFNYPDIAEQAIDEALENEELSTIQRGELTEAVAQQLIDAYGITVENGEPTVDHSIDSANMERGYRELLQEAVDSGMVDANANPDSDTQPGDSDSTDTEPTEAERAADQLGWEDPVTDIVQTDDTVIVDDASAFEFDKLRGLAPPFEVDVSFVSDTYIEGMVDTGMREIPVTIDDLTGIDGIKFESEPDNTADLISLDVTKAAEDVFGRDSDIYAAADDLIFPDVDETIDVVTETALENGYERDEIEAFLENVGARNFTYPDAQELEQFDVDISEEVIDALAEAGDVPDGLIPDVTEEATRRANVRDREPTGTDYLIAAKKVLKSQADVYAERSFSETVREQVAPNTLDAAEVDEIAIGDRLTGAFHYAEMVGSARDLLGITAGNTTGDEMMAFEYADGSFDLGVPTDAYEDITTAVVDSPEEAIRNNRDSPRVVSAFGGSTCETTITTDPDGEEYIMKEGLSGETFAGAVGHDSTIEVGDKIYEETVETVAAAYFVGNRDLHTKNLFVTDDDSVAIIDHDSAGYGSLGSVAEPGRILSFTVQNMLPDGIVADIEAQVRDMARKYENGEIALPDDISRDHKMYLEDAVAKIDTTPDTESSAVGAGENTSADTAAQTADSPDATETATHPTEQVTPDERGNEADTGPFVFETDVGSITRSD